MFERIATDAVTFFVVVNPIGVLPMFIATTRAQAPAARRATALRAVAIAALILIGFVVVGQALLEALGITIPSFRIAGGLVLLAIGMRMILEEERPQAAADRSEAGSEPARDVAVFPLAMPMIAGPGAIMAAVLLTDNERFSPPEQAVTTLVLLAVLALTYVLFLLADAILRVLTVVGANVMSRVMGLVLAALAVETMLGGIRAAFSLR